MQTIKISRPPPVLPAPLTRILPPHLCDAAERCGAERIEEIRLHSKRIATVSAGGRNYSTGIILSDSDMQNILQKMCGGSLYAFSQSICQGYLCMQDGIRVGVAGSAAIEDGRIIGVNSVSGLIIRIPQKTEVSAATVISHLRRANGLRGVLIYAPPGVGKTTLLRAVAKEAASPAVGLRTVAVDTREELCYTLDGCNLLLDILIGYPRQEGIEIAVRTLGAQLIVCDEIGDSRDAKAILSAAGCGVPLVASAHAASIEDLLARPAIHQLHTAHVFGTYIGLCREGSRFSYTCTTWEEANRFLTQAM